MKKIVILTGETSGDWYASLIIATLIKKRYDYEYHAIGGNHLNSLNSPHSKKITLLARYQQIQAFGFYNAIRKYPTIHNSIAMVRTWMEENHPALIILVDNWGFNSRIAAHAKKLNIKVLCVIPPKVWAWKEDRIEKLKYLCDQIAVIYPFEKDFLLAHNCPNVTYVGNPLRTLYENIPFPIWPKKGEKLSIGLLPGSREQELKNHVPILNNLVSKIIKKNLPYQVSFSLPISDALEPLYDKFEFHKKIEKRVGSFHSLLPGYHLCVTASGTAALEVALAKAIQVVFYNTNWFDSIILKHVVKTPYISLPNILQNKSFIAELLYKNSTSNHIYEEIMALITNAHLRLSQQTELQQIQKKLESKNSFESNAVKIIDSLLS